ncbi:winged helix-turn-helix transcriptional regulator [Cognatishimia maritima]|uniref:Transcriptional regulator, HxlR family n=1 Tax=Cognatishimia maritima TaxID=870908 RepID=A0A1M5NI37_9RHOB|nr:helix-turn-helix domain-containing protein [Cognatishimia maritima]SHG88613.1 transcriptional regulator, HxlR family [Cognatishimia maritima]
MSTKSKRNLSGCPIDYALSVLGDRWSLIIVRDLAIRGAKTYAELLDGWEGISTNILAQRMRHLESNGIVEKRKNPANWRSSIYELTPKGRDLAPVLAEIILWGGAYNESDSPKNEAYDTVKSDRAKFEAAIRENDEIAQ